MIFSSCPFPSILLCKIYSKLGETKLHNMSSHHQAPEPDQRPEEGRIKIAIDILDALINERLIPLYESFKVHELFKNLDEEHQKEELVLSDLVEKILINDDLIEVHHSMHLHHQLTSRGREMMTFGSYTDWGSRPA